ncbi:hypothetical protein CKO51_07655 [Rhodopirellula sp. SM50]|nr:hypothetical protein CKO51_07655 [Rhodopirellula sp. SM50]
MQISDRLPGSRGDGSKPLVSSLQAPLHDAFGARTTGHQNREAELLELIKQTISGITATEHTHG